MHSSPPARTPKSQLAAEQASIGECWNTPKKGTPNPRAKEKLWQDGRRSAVMFKSNLILSGDAWKAQTKPCVHQNPGKGAVTPSPPPHTRDCARHACSCLRVSFRGMGQQLPAAGTGDLAAAVLVGSECGINPCREDCHEPHYKATGWMILKLENKYTKEVLALL